MAQAPNNRNDLMRSSHGSGNPKDLGPPEDLSERPDAENRCFVSDDRLRRQIIDITENEYDVGRVTGLCEIKGGYCNRSFEITVDQGGRVRNYVVRQYWRGITEEEIHFEHALIQYAIDHGLHLAAGIVATKAGKTYIRRNSDEDIHALYEYLPGEDKYAWDRPDLTDTEIYNAGEVLALFHNAVCEFDPQTGRRKEDPIVKLWPTLLNNLKQFADADRPGKVIPYLRKNLNRIQETISRNTLAEKDIESLPVIPNHYDYHPGNLKWDGETVVGIFDFDWSKIDLRLFDVCTAMVHFGSCWGGEKDGNLRLDKCELFLRGYQERLISLNGQIPLMTAEQALFLKIMVWANLYLLHWGVSAYLENVTSDDAEYLTYLKHSVRLMRWIDAHPTELTECFGQVLA
jgi:homoserine kinase type II